MHLKAGKSRLFFNDILTISLRGKTTDEKAEKIQDNVTCQKFLIS